MYGPSLLYFASQTVLLDVQLDWTRELRGVGAQFTVARKFPLYTFIRVAVLTDLRDFLGVCKVLFVIDSMLEQIVKTM